MITIEDKLFITKEVNHILYDYAQKIVLRDLLFQYSFGNHPNTDDITELLKNISYYNGDTPPPEEQLQLMELIDRFIEELTSEKRVALNFWILNKKYLEFLDDTEIEDEDEKDTKELFNKKFGRELAYKLYEPKNSGLNEDIFNYLNSLLITFSSEMDFSKIDEATSRDIVETINIYCDTDKIENRIAFL